MIKNATVFLLLLFTTLGFSASQYDKDITVLNQSRNDRVTVVFKEMMKAYEEEDLSGFFSYVSEDRFIQDYMTFYDAIDKDMRVYDILNVDTWIDKITTDGIKRYLYVRWDKRYQSISSDAELEKKGYSRFLFDEVNGKYKLIGLAGNNFWGGSLAQWKGEVPDIAGQEPKSSNALPDLLIVGAITFNGTISVRIKNQGDKDVTSSIEVKDTSNGNSVVYNNGLSIGSTAFVSIQGSIGDSVVVDPSNAIQELDETNNNAIASGVNVSDFTQ